MEIRPARSWSIDTHSARELQEKLAKNVIRFSHGLAPQTIAGIDVSIARFSRKGRSAIVVLRWPGLDILEVSLAEGEINFPYVPGLLSFREVPLILEAWKQLGTRPDLIMVDGQGIAHPRRLGIASHLGLLLDVASIGCAKSRLIGEHEPLPEQPGAHAYLMHGDEIVGAALRTRRSVKPVYVSIGHKIDLGDSILWVINCCRGLRLPEPTRLAHLAAGGHLQTRVAAVRKTKY
jgi:deoxyribonuclease V